MDLISGRERKLAYLVALLATCASWTAILLSGDSIKSLDERDFLAITKNVAFNGTFALDPDTPTAYRAPGLVFFLTPAVRLGATLMEARLVNAALIGIGLVILFHLIRRHAGPLAGFIAVCMVPLWPVTIYTATTIYPQTLAAFLLVLTLWLLDYLRDGPGIRYAALAGLSYGAMILTIPVALLLTPILLAWIYFSGRRWLTHGLVFCFLSGALVGTWTIRNYIVFESFVPVATSSGYNLLAGNTAEARYNTSLNVRFPEYVYTEITGKNEVEQNDIMTRAAFNEISKDPTRFISRYIGKFLHWFHFSNKLLSDEVIEGGASSIKVSMREFVLSFTYFCVIFCPLVLHLIFLRRVPFRPVEVLFLALWIGAGLVYALYFTRVRFRLPFDWLLIASNAMFLAAFFEKHFHRTKKNQTK